MNKTYALPKVVRTWALLFSIPLYVGTSTLWLKEEIKSVVNQKEGNIISSIEEQAKKSLATKNGKQKPVLLP